MEAAALLLLLALFGRRKTDVQQAVTPGGSTFKELAEKTVASLKETAPPSQAALPSPGVNVFATAWKTRTTALVKRAASGARWTPMLSKAFGGNAGASTAAARWIGIESGGKTSTTTPLGEYGLAQGMKENYSAADWIAVRDPKTTDEQHAAIAARLIMRDVKATTRSNKATPGTLGLGYLYHALPLMVRELREQGLLKESVAETLVGTLGPYKASAKVASYVKGKHAVTSNVNQNIVLRFFAPAAVVAYGENAISLLDSLADAAARAPSA